MVVKQTIYFTATTVIILNTSNLAVILNPFFQSLQDYTPW